MRSIDTGLQFCWESKIPLQEFRLIITHTHKNNNNNNNFVIDKNSKESHGVLYKNPHSKEIRTAFNKTLLLQYTVLLRINEEKCIFKLEGQCSFEQPCF